MGRKRVNRRRTKKQARFEWSQLNWRRPVYAAVLLGVLGVTYEGTMWLMDRPIDAIVVQGAFERVPAVRVESALVDHLHQGFLSVNLNILRQKVEALPWVERATVRRKWPAQILVSVFEEQAVARWGDDGLLNTYGHLFVDHATHIPVELPRLQGPDGTQEVVVHRYADLQKKLAQRGLSAISLELDQRGAWQLEISNGMSVRFGAFSIDQRINRFFRAFDPVIAPVGEHVSYVDMRYTNGFAIGWKTPGSFHAQRKQEADPNA
ncbi:MAG: cell division protein FtsQ/DivIB [Gammaproteobacteria bacterium]